MADTSFGEPESPAPDQASRPRRRIISSSVAASVILTLVVAFVSKYSGSGSASDPYEGTAEGRRRMLETQQPARRSIERGEIDAGINILEMLIRGEDPDDPAVIEARRTIVEASCMLDDPSRGHEHAQRLVAWERTQRPRHNARLAGALACLGTIHAAADRHTSAITSFEEAITLTADRGLGAERLEWWCDTRIRLASSLDAVGRADEATALLRTSLDELDTEALVGTDAAQGLLDILAARHEAAGDDEHARELMRRFGR